MASSSSSEPLTQSPKRKGNQIDYPNKRRELSPEGTDVRQRPLDIDSEAFGQKMREYGIEFLGALSPARWPSEYRDLFVKISDIKRVTADKYNPGSAAPALNETGQPIEWDTGRIAQRLVFQAKACRDHFMGENSWRHRTEPIVLARFSAECACAKCRQRLWISDFPAPTRDPKASLALRRRREKRARCECDPATRPLGYSKSGLGYIFNDHVEPTVVHDPEDGLGRAVLKSQKPDRVFGLQATENIDELLEKLPEFRHSPIKDHKLPYPFLVLEAKSEKSGDGFGSIGRQTAFPIRTLLKTQQKLGSAPGASPYFRPLVWFIAFKGDEWRVHCCIPINKKFSIINLWQGSILNEDCAVQLLLIVDYICDWARDVYRPYVIESLDGICRRQVGRRSRAPAPSPCDSNIWSLRHSFTFHDDGSVRTSRSPNPTSCAIDESHPLLQFAKPVKDNYWDWTRFAAIQHASVVRYTFTGIHLTEQNTLAFLDELMSLRDQRHSRAWILQALARLIKRPAMLTPSVLRRIESSWTGKAPNFVSSTAVRKEYPAHIAYRTYFGSDYWEATREILCITSTPIGLMSLTARIKNRLRNDRECNLDLAMFSDRMLYSNLRNIPLEALCDTIERIRDWGGGESIVAAALGLQWCLEGPRSLARSANDYLPCQWNGQFEVIDESSEFHYLNSTWALGTKQDADILGTDGDGIDHKTISLKLCDAAGHSSAYSTTSLRQVQLTPAEDHPPFRVPKLPESVEQSGVLLLRRAEPHVRHPRMYCLFAFEQAASFGDPENMAHLAAKMRRSFMARELYTARVANQPTKENLGRLPVKEFNNDITGAINLWIARLQGQKPTWSDWQFYDYQTRNQYQRTIKDASSIPRTPFAKMLDIANEQIDRRLGEVMNLKYTQSLSYDPSRFQRHTLRRAEQKERKVELLYDMKKDDILSCVDENSFVSEMRAEATEKPGNGSKRPGLPSNES